MNVPFVDLKKQYQSIQQEILSSINCVFEDGTFVSGQYLQQFENEFASLHGVNHCIGVGNGTDAIFTILKMLGIGAGDEVIIPSHNWISSAEMITLTGATPVFVDSDSSSNTFTIDPKKIEAKITPHTKAILPVHLYGQPAHIHAIKSIADKFNLYLIEDCAQSILAEEDNQRVGTFGIASAFSFYPTKNLGAYGDGGAILTNDDGLAKKMRAFANHGMIEKNVHAMQGINSRLDSIQAAVLSVKLKHIESWNEKRIHLANRYSSLLRDIPFIELPVIRDNVKHVFHLYAIRTPQREALQKYLSSKGIQTSIHYPLALPFLTPYKSVNSNLDTYPIAFRDQNQILSLPLYPELSVEAIQHVCSSIAEFFKR
ncbi:MAG TPA: DegT/DnrJ/EryC1/StrS family aminotransferase [Chryseolinea sp.]|nr:DegT/DnrJ/EryC1/StrS family aminotransferase [Chryseolinea sp.]